MMVPPSYKLVYQPHEYSFIISTIKPQINIDKPSATYPPFSQPFSSTPGGPGAQAGRLSGPSEVEDQLRNAALLLLKHL